ncbi:biotin--[acetyl-CoA-carboxylase] ligase [Frigoribacterium sp. VKM Ac-2836]|uniref:biotin--[acetyl-CoA-carboxylase] ligase n=1 Tax=Frigoribacterium sp. VKM Ac-2836 TaxID=2739014 RepID=UPI0015640FD2|nr:biotin--[acetyl-CoA-carboxylase] ligase [Frigoribacterium sp. VKM Ac-2836]NRD25401.1 biotin--[acetyl-CoA-carboxylase] ligase [Frigoribacterium sp. VKM Ac-2836]
MAFPLSATVSPHLVVLESTGSTNADLLAAVDEPHLATWLTLDQSAGRGRLDRRWESVPGRSLAASVLLHRGDLPIESLGWVPLLAGVAMRASVLRVVESGDVTLKWPNDVQVDGDKVCGLLAELRPDASAVVVGAGVNLTVPGDELPTPTSTSLGLHGARGTALELADVVLSSWVSGLTRLVGDLAASRGDAAASGAQALVRADCATLGREVRVELPGGAALVGEAVDVDEAGRLVVRSASTGGLTAVASGDVTHLRYE